MDRFINAEREAHAAIIAWRNIDRRVPPDDPEGWAALMRLRDAADRLSEVRQCEIHAAVSA